MPLRRKPKIQTGDHAGSTWLGEDARWLCSRVSPYSLGYYCLILLVSGGGVMTVVDPLIMRWVLDSVIPSRSLALLAVAAVLFLLSYSGRIFFDQRASVLSTRLTHLFIVVLRKDLLRHLLRLPARYHDHVGAGETLFYVNDEARQVGEFAITGTVEITRTVVSTTVTLVTMMLVNARITLVVLPLIAIYTLLKRRWGQGMFEASEHVQKESVKLSSVTHQIGSGIRQIQLLGCERTILKHFVHRGRALRDAVLARKNWDYRFTLLARTAIVAGISILLGYGGFLVSAGRMTIGTLVALYSYILRICEPLAQAVDLDSRYEKGRTSLRTMHRIVVESRALGESSGRCLPLPLAPPRIVLAGVTFAYPGRPTVLHDVNLVIAPGERIGLIGETGSGKTTILKLLLRLYDCSEGAIYLDTEDIAKMDARAIRALFAVVPQDPFVFDGSLRDNLLLANRDATSRQVQRALETSHLEALVRRLPNGLNHSVGPQGAQLSGGERQRLALARALLKPAPIVLLDEFSSALDMATEELVLRDLRAALSDRSVIAASHRPAVISWMDRTYRVRSGRLLAADCPDPIAREDYNGSRESAAVDYKEALQ